MPKSKNCLPDVNVWLALVSKRHAHYEMASRWFDSFQDTQAAFCRVTQMSLLRLLTNRTVMGDDVQTMAQAWTVYEKARADPRVAFLLEPYGLENDWKRTTSARTASKNTWTDAYLAAFCRAAGLAFVTFDKQAYRLLPSQAVLLG